MMNFKNEEAVSPVIGVILMVAITVILAAVIAAFVFGMGSNIGTTKTVAVTAVQNDNTVVLTYHGGADAATLNYLKITVTDGSNNANVGTKFLYLKKGETEVTDETAAPASGTEYEKLPVGTTAIISGFASAQQDHVVVTGHFADGSDQVVLDTYV